MFRIIFILCVLGIVSGCRLTEKTIIHKYKGYGGFEYGYFLNIKANHTFEYTWQEGLLQGKTTGSWELMDHELILNSDLQPESQLLETALIPGNKIKVKVVDEHKITIPFVHCVLRGGEQIIERKDTEPNGTAQFDLTPFDTLSLYCLGYKNLHYKVDEQSGNYFVFRMLPDTYLFFENERWMIKGRRIFRPNKNENQPFWITRRNSFKRIRN